MKRTALIAALFLLLLSAACAESMDGMRIDRALVHQQGDGYTYYTYECGGFTETGELAVTQLDLNGDATDETVTVFMEEDQTVYLDIDGCRTALFTPWYLCSSEAYDVFYAVNEGEITIWCEAWQGEELIADGMSWTLTGYRYDGNEIIMTSSFYLNGTCFSDSLDDWLENDLEPEHSYAEKLRACGFKAENICFGNMLCEQQHDLRVLCRLYSGCNSGLNVSRFIEGSGRRLEGFFTGIVDCTKSNMQIPAEDYVSEFRNAILIYGTDDEDTTAPDSYIIADSDTCLLTREALESYDEDTLAYIRNEILARHGYPFTKKKYRTYFESKNWYTRNEDFQYSDLSPIEMENVSLIKSMEEEDDDD